MALGSNNTVKSIHLNDVGFAFDSEAIAGGEQSSGALGQHGGQVHRTSTRKSVACPEVPSSEASPWSDALKSVHDASGCFRFETRLVHAPAELGPRTKSRKSALGRGAEGLVWLRIQDQEDMESLGKPALEQAVHRRTRLSHAHLMFLTR